MNYAIDVLKDAIRRNEFAYKQALRERESITKDVDTHLSAAASVHDQILKIRTAISYLQSGLTAREDLDTCKEYMTSKLAALNSEDFEIKRRMEAGDFDVVIRPGLYAELNVILLIVGALSGPTNLNQDSVIQCNAYLYGELKRLTEGHSRMVDSAISFGNMRDRHDEMIAEMIQRRQQVEALIQLAQSVKGDAE